MYILWIWCCPSCPACSGPALGVWSVGMEASQAPRAPRNQIHCGSGARLCKIPFLLLGSNFPHLSAGMLQIFGSASGCRAEWENFNITTLLRFQISHLSIVDRKYVAFSEIQRLTFSNVAEDSQTRSALRSLSFVLIVVDHAQRRCLAMRGTHHTRDFKRLQETSDFDLIDQVSEDQKYVWYTST